MSSCFISSGDQTRTDDLRVMSPTSYQLLHPAIFYIIYLFFLLRWTAKVSIFPSPGKCLVEKVN